MTYSVKKLGEDDWRIFSRIRLKALHTDPKSFGSNYDRESKFSEEDWRSRLRDPNSAIFMVVEGLETIGLTAVSLDRNDGSRRTALFWGSWIEPASRGKGISRLMYQARLDWVNERPTIQRVVVSHRESNLASKFANRKFGFALTDMVEKTWSDGSVEDECSYELNLSSRE